MTKNFSQKGFTANFLSFINDLERNKLCCLDFLTKVYTDNSTSVTFTGNGTKSDPLVAITNTGTSFELETSGSTGPATFIGGILNIPNYSAASGSTTVPGGSDTSIQYNKAGAFAGDASLTWDYTNKVLGISQIAGNPSSALSFGSQASVPGIFTEFARFVSTGNLLIGTQTDNGSLLQIAGVGNFQPSVGVGQCITMGNAGFINAAFALVSSSVQAPGFQDWVFQCDTLGFLRINEDITGAQVASFAVLNNVPQFISLGAIYPGQYSTTDKLALVVQHPGALVYDTTLNQMSYWNGTTWVNF